MAKITRATQLLFGSTATAASIAKFGSLAAGTPVTYSGSTVTPANIQALSNYLTGWLGAIIGGNSPAVEDMNALCYLFSYQLGYLLQTGIPEWDSGTTYYQGSIVTDTAGGGLIYVSLTNTNLNNALSSATNWTLVGGQVMTTLGDFTYGGTNGAQTRLAGNTSATVKLLAQTGTGTVSAAPVLSTLQTLGILTKINVVAITSTQTYTPSTGLVAATVEIQAGGGGAGGTTAGSGSNICGSGGGGGGEYAKKTYSAATIGSSQTVTIAGVANGGGNGSSTGTAGGTTSFGALLTAVGGSGGGASSGVASGNYGFISGGGTGGTGGTGSADVRRPGGAGKFSYITNSACWSGDGGHSFYGTGAVGTAISVGGTSANGLGAAQYGAGGGGSVSYNAATNTGGSGSGGICYITEYIAI